MHYRLDFSNFSTIQAAVNSILAGVSSMDLSDDRLFMRTADELVEILGAIPASVSSLNLSYNELYLKNPAWLV